MPACYPPTCLGDGPSASSPGPRGQRTQMPAVPATRRDRLAELPLLPQPHAQASNSCSGRACWAHYRRTSRRSWGALRGWTRPQLVGGARTQQASLPLDNHTNQPLTRHGKQHARAWWSCHAVLPLHSPSANAAGRRLFGEARKPSGPPRRPRPASTPSAQSFRAPPRCHRGAAARPSA